MPRTNQLFPMLLALFLQPFAMDAMGQADLGPFGIRVIDEETGRGVPMVKLRTTNDISVWTDSAGWVAWDEPGLMSTKVYFFVEADGYEHRADGFDFRGVRLETKPGESAEIKIKRKNIAERLYRATGGGIYRDSVLLGKAAPLEEPVLNGRVLGQDSVQSIVYKEKIYWFWGDTTKPDYPLGNFSSSAALSDLPKNGGLPPSIGIDFTYLVDEAGFSRKAVDWDEPGMKWIDGFMLLKDPNGVERLVARCERVKNLGENLGRGLIQWDDEAMAFKYLAPFTPETKLAPAGKPFLHTVEGVDYYYFSLPFPSVRVKADWNSVLDPKAYEGWSCLEAGANYDKENPKIERDASGKIVWAWKQGAVPLSWQEQDQLVKQGTLSEAERWLAVRDAETSESVHLWGGTVAWNPYREKFIMIAYQMWGKPSGLGEVWYSEADNPEGPWPWARKIVTHEKYTFYNPVHHPFFDEDGGKVIYFEGTYSDLFTDVERTPRYNYNQIMYRLNLEDDRLRFPK